MDLMGNIAGIYMIHNDTVFDNVLPRYDGNRAIRALDVANSSDGFRNNLNRLSGMPVFIYL
jgi:hypothetical protein